MKKLILVLMILVLIGPSCKEDEERKCPEITDPLTQVQPLKDLIDGTHACAGGDLTIYSCRYQNETVYYFEKPNAADAACRLAVYDCLGTLLFNGTDEVKVSEFIAGRTECATLWENTCPAITDPLIQVQPLKDLIDGTHACAGGDLTIYSCRYQNETVYYFEKPYAAGPFPPSPILTIACNLGVYNCFGEMIFDATDEAKVNEFATTRTDCTILWKNTCEEINDPLTEIQSLTALVNGTHPCSNTGFKVEIYKCQYLGENAYYFRNFFTSFGICTYRIYNCFGEEISRPGTNDFYDEFIANSTNCVLLFETP